MSCPTSSVSSHTHRSPRDGRPRSKTTRGVGQGLDDPGRSAKASRGADFPASVPSWHPLGQIAKPNMPRQRVVNGPRGGEIDPAGGVRRPRSYDLAGPEMLQAGAVSACWPTGASHRPLPVADDPRQRGSPPRGRPGDDVLFRKVFRSDTASDHAASQTSAPEERRNPMTAMRHGRAAPPSGKCRSCIHQTSSQGVAAARCVQGGVLRSLSHVRHPFRAFIGSPPRALRLSGDLSIRVLHEIGLFMWRWQFEAGCLTCACVKKRAIKIYRIRMTMCRVVA